MTDQIEVVRYVSRDVRCPVCQRWRRELVITAEGYLLCGEKCPALERMRRPRARKGAAA